MESVAEQNSELNLGQNTQVNTLISTASLSLSTCRKPMMAEHETQLGEPHSRLSLLYTHTEYCKRNHSVFWAVRDQNSIYFLHSSGGNASENSHPETPAGFRSWEGRIFSHSENFPQLILAFPFPHLSDCVLPPSFALLISSHQFHSHLPLSLCTPPLTFLLFHVLNPLDKKLALTHHLSPSHSSLWLSVISIFLYPMSACSI